MQSVSITRLIFFLRTLRKRMWFRALTYALIGVATAVIGLFAGEWVPESMMTKVGSDAVGNILSILASSMLAVATFSLSIMVTAFANVSTGATPRASRLLIEDQKAQRAVATFIGAFLYSVVGIVALATGAYGEPGRFVLFVGTILVIIFIVVTLIRWVDQLSSLGRMGKTVSTVEQATMGALKARAEQPYLGGRKKTSEDSYSEKIYAADVGFVAYVNVDALQIIAKKINAELSLELLPGSFVFPGREVASCSRTVKQETIDEILSHFVIQTARTFDLDPRFGFVLLSEIGSKALSPGINDAGTALEVISATTRIFTNWSNLKRAKANSEIIYDRISVPDLSEQDMFDDFFGPIGRDGAALVEVGIKILRSLKSLAVYDPELFKTSAQIHSQMFLERAEKELKHPADLQKLKSHALG